MESKICLWGPRVGSAAVPRAPPGRSRSRRVGCSEVHPSRHRARSHGFPGERAAAVGGAAGGEREGLKPIPAGVKRGA